MSILMARQAEASKEKTLEDGGMNEFHCQACQTQLLTIWVTRPNLELPDGTPYDASYRAHCHKCGGYSDTKNIKGGVTFINPAVKDENGKEKVLSFWSGFDMVDGVTVIETKKHV